MNKKKEEGIEISGVVTAAMGGDKFKVAVKDEEGNLVEGHEVVAHLAGKMRRFYIRIVPGDDVKVELSPYDLTKGRITYRNK